MSPNPAAAPEKSNRLLSGLAILLGVVLFGVVAYALTRGGSSGGTAGLSTSRPTLNVTPATLPTEEPVVDVTEPGTIEFGKDVNDDVTIKSPPTRFDRTSTKIGWVAHLGDPAGASSLTFVVASRGAGGSERSIIKTDVDVTNPDFDTFGNALDLALLLDRKPGTYVMRYLRDADVLAEGTFTLIK